MTMETTARRQCADGMTTADDDMTTMRRQRDDRHKRGFDMS